MLLPLRGISTQFLGFQTVSFQSSSSTRKVNRKLCDFCHLTCLVCRGCRVPSLQAKSPCQSIPDASFPPEQWLRLPVSAHNLCQVGQQCPHRDQTHTCWAVLERMHVCLQLPAWLLHHRTVWVGSLCQQGKSCITATSHTTLPLWLLI